MWIARSVSMRQLPLTQLERVCGGTSPKKGKPDDEQQPENSVAMVERDLANKGLSMWPIRGRHVSFQFKEPGGGVSNAQLLESDQHPSEASAFLTPGTMDPHQRIVGIHQLSPAGFLEARECAQRVVNRYNENGPRPYSKLNGPSSSGFAQAVNDECHLGFENQFSPLRDWQHDYWKRPGHRF
jgi:hypothetical protein